MKFCPECGSVLELEQKICEHCGYDIEKQDISEDFKQKQNQYLQEDNFVNMQIIAPPPSMQQVGFGMAGKMPSEEMKELVIRLVLESEDTDEEVTEKISNAYISYYPDNMIVNDAKTALQKDYNKIVAGLNTDIEYNPNHEIDVGVNQLMQTNVAIYEQFKVVLKVFLADSKYTDDELQEVLQKHITKYLERCNNEQEREQLKNAIVKLKTRDLNSIAKKAGKNIIEYRQNFA